MNRAAICAAQSGSLGWLDSGIARLARALLDGCPLELRQIIVQCRIFTPGLAGVQARVGDPGLVRRERPPAALTDVGRTLAATLTPAPTSPAPDWRGRRVAFAHPRRSPRLLTSAARPSRPP